MIAALFVDPKGSYANLPGIDLWDERRDARRYPGPWPVIAHPPCTRWCQLAGLVEARWGHKKGDDDGCFQSALGSVRRWGGVIEHPAYSKAWDAFSLGKPSREGGWVQADSFGGYTCYVEQGRYGHPAKKATWLYAVGIPKLPDLRWGYGYKGNSLVSRCANHVDKNDKRRRLEPKEAAATPPAFRNVLLAIVRQKKLTQPVLLPVGLLLRANHRYG